jgi:general secretion pathway protein C
MILSAGLACGEPAATSSAKTALPPADAAPPPKPDAGPFVELAPERLDQAIRRLDDTRYAVDKGLYDTVMADKRHLLASAKAVPAAQDGKVVGFRLFMVRPGSLLARLGLQNGDVVGSVAGLPLTTIDELKKAFAALKTAPRVTITLTRKDVPMSLEWTVE